MDTDLLKHGPKLDFAVNALQLPFYYINRTNY